MLKLDQRPYVIAPSAYDGTVTNTLTYKVAEQTFVLKGRDALTTYGVRACNSHTGRILFHGSYKSPAESGRVLLPQQAYSKKNDGTLVPQGEPAISTSTTPDFPVVRSLFKEGAPAFIDYPADEMILCTRGDGLGNEFTIVTKGALDRVRKMNPTGFVSVLPERKPKRGDAIPYAGPDKKTSEYRIMQAATPIFVMPVTVDDLPPSLMVVPDAYTGRKIRDSLDRIDPQYYSPFIEDIFGEPYFQTGYRYI